MPPRDKPDVSQKPQATSTPLASIAPPLSRPAPKPVTPPHEVPVSAAPVAEDAIDMTTDAAETEADVLARLAAVDTARDAAREEARRQAAMPYDAVADAAARQAKEREASKTGRGRKRSFGPSGAAGGLFGGSGRAATSAKTEAGPVPRTIAEMQRQAAGEPFTPAARAAAPDALDAPTNATDMVDDEPEVTLRVPLRSVAIATGGMWLLAVLLPQVVFAIGRAVNSDPQAITPAYPVVLALGGTAALLVLGRAWRWAFGTAPEELSWRTLPDIWKRRYGPTRYAGGFPRRNSWVTMAIAVIFGLLLLFGLLSYAYATSFPKSLPNYLLFLLVLFAKSVSGVVFLGFLQRALTAHYAPTRAATIAGAAYGVGIALSNALAFITPSTPLEGGTPLTASETLLAAAIATALGFLVCVALAWFRLRTKSVYAGVALQLTLFLLRLPV